MQSNFKNKELLRLFLSYFMVIYGLKCKIKAVALKKKSNFIKISDIDQSTKRYLNIL
jgi:hypothetical protein